MQELIAQHLDLWTSAIQTRATAGRGTGAKSEAYGVKKLKELILDLAIQGKLVPQNSQDIPAREILNDVRVKRAELLRAKEISKSKVPVPPTEPPVLQIPTSWAWTSLYELGEISPRNDARDSIVASFVPMTMISEHYGEPAQHEPKLWKEIKSGFTHFREGDVVLAKITPCFQNGKSAVMRNLTGGLGAGTTELHVFRPISDKIVPEYVLIYLKSRKFISDGVPKLTGTAGQKRITRDYFAGSHFPLPPFEEQKRIVAKVDELMTLCDQLEQQQSASLEAHQTLVATLLDTLNHAESATDFQQAWQRISTHFDTLFTTEHSIDQLKQTIKQLAIMGKIVRQDPNDGSSLTLLERIGKEKRQTRKPGLIRRSTEFSPASSADIPFSIPASWNVVRLGELTLKIGSGSTPRGGKSAYLDAGIPFLRSQNIWNDGLKMEDVAYISKETHERMSNTKVQTDDLLLNITGASLGRCTIFPDSIGEANVSQHVTIIRPALPALQRYLHYFFLSPYAQSLIWGRQVGVAREGLSKKVLEQFEVPLPPLAEQQRIVARLDQLLSICESIEHRLQRGKAIQCQIADTIVKEALN